MNIYRTRKVILLSGYIIEADNTHHLHQKYILFCSVLCGLLYFILTKASVCAAAIENFLTFTNQ